MIVTAWQQLHATHIDTVTLKHTHTNTTHDANANALIKHTQRCPLEQTG